MGNTYSWPIVRLVQRLSMVLTLGCCVYVIVFLFTKNQDNFMPEKSNIISKKALGLVAPAPVFDLKPYDTSANAQGRDIFSSTTTVSPTGTVENTPKGQLPAHFKIVGIVIAHPSQIIVEDSFVNKTYFIDEGGTQAGIKIVRVDKDKMTINYQGQNIDVPITKN